MKHKDSILKYDLINKNQNNALKGTKLIILQKRLIPNEKFLLFFKKWKHTEIILFKPNLDNFKKIIKHPYIKENDWIILSKDFKNYDKEGIQIKNPRDPICKNKRLLKELIKY